MVFYQSRAWCVAATRPIIRNETTSDQGIGGIDSEPRIRNGCARSHYHRTVVWNARTDAVAPVSGIATKDIDTKVIGDNRVAATDGVDARPLEILNAKSPNTVIV